MQRTTTKRLNEVTKKINNIKNITKQIINQFERFFDEDLQSFPQLFRYLSSFPKAKNLDEPIFFYQRKLKANYLQR